MEKLKHNKVSEEKIDELNSQFFEKLVLVLKQNSPTAWSKMLDISANVVNAAWVSGKSLPRVDNLIKILANTGISANWLLLGVGPMLLEDAYNDDFIQESDKKRRKTHYLINRLQEEILAHKILVESVEIADKIGKLFDKETGQILANTPEAIAEMSAAQIFDKIIMPLASLISSFNLLSFKFLEKLASSENGSKKLRLVFETLSSELDTKSLSSKLLLRDMDKIFDKIDI